MKRIKYIVLCVCMALVACQREEDITIATLTYSNETITSLYYTADISCVLNCNAPFKDVYVHYSTHVDFADYQVRQMNPGKKGSYSIPLSDLEPDVTYFVRYEVSNTVSTVCSKEYSEFRTMALSTPVLSTVLDPTTITYNSAVVGGKIILDGGLNITERGVVYGIGDNPTIDNGVVIFEQAQDSFVCALNDLEVVTTYYARAYARNSLGVSYGESIRFETLSTVATMDSIAVSTITDNTATIVAGVLVDGGSAVTKRGVCYSKSEMPSTEDSVIVCEGELGDYTCEIANLYRATTYYVRAFAINANGTAYSEQLQFTTDETLPILTTVAAKNITSNSATVGGNVIDDGGAEVTERGVVYSTSQNPTTSDNKVQSEKVVANFTCDLVGLQVVTTYYARAYAINEKGTAYGDEISFTTLSTSAILGKPSASSITSNTASISAEVLADGGASISERGVVYGTCQSPTLSDNKVMSQGGVGVFTCNLTHLHRATTYYVRAYATNANGTAYSESVHFSTLTTLAIVSTIEATNISYTSATVGGNVTDDGGAEVTERGVVYSTNQSPTTEDNKIASGSSTGSFSCNLTELQDGVTYYARAYAVNEKGTAYGEEVSFTTKAKTVATVSTTEPTSIIYTSAVVGGTVTDDGGAEVTERGVVYSTLQNPTTSDNKVTSGSGTGSFSCNLTELQDGVTYYARAYAVNEKGTAYGEEVSFTTKAKTVATVSTTEPTNILYTSATIGGNVIDDGGAEVTERGVVYSTSQNPTTSDNKVTSGSGTGSFSCNLTELQDGVTYYARAYAVNEKGTAYGEEVSFTTKAKTVATVSTTEPTNILYTSATIGGNVIDDGGSDVTDRGVVYSTHQNPTTEDNKIASGNGLGSFSCNLTELQEGVTYYARAYAVNEKGIVYGEQVVFTTLTLCIDLGLSVKWATCNVGAESPEDYGDYFAWGETEPKETYNWSTYKWCNGSLHTQTKYNTDSDFGTVDNKTELELSDDAARANWGGSWRMPTYAEMTELCEQCTWTWTTQNGVNGYQVTSKSNGNSIFLPAAGYRYDSSLEDAGSIIRYWSSSLITYNDHPYCAIALGFGSDGVVWHANGRFIGQSVRPVCP